MAATRLIGRTLLAATALAGATLTPAATATAAPGADSSLKLSVHSSERGPLRSTDLKCGPASGSHPSSSRACQSLTEVDGQFDQLHDKGKTMCPLDYRPVTLRATGTWQNRPVDFTKTYSNECVGVAQTDNVFKF